MNGDGYGSMIREGMKKSMEHPAGFKPLNRVEPSFWQKHSEEVGFALWIVVVFILCTMAWVGLNAAESAFR